MKEKTEYEKERDLRISQNMARLEALGVPKIVSSLKDIGVRRESHSAAMNDEDADYVPSSDEDASDEFSHDNSSDATSSIKAGHKRDILTQEKVDNIVLLYQKVSNI